MKQNIARITIAYTSLLVLLGVGGYLFSGMQSVTALIPAFFGAVVAIVLLLTIRRTRPATILWTLLGLAALGFLATMSGVPKTVSLVLGNDVARPGAVVSQGIMAVLSMAYGLALFTVARKKSLAYGDA